ncbi:MAG: tetratricopeptide repeat protein [Candidatus Brocadiia bacterium]
MGTVTTFGKYILEKKIGQGGMGAVYLAVDPALNRKVALKVATASDKTAVERFQREVQAVAKLRHANIVQVFEVGTIGKQPYFTMEYVDGISFEQLIKDKTRPPVQTVAKIVMQIASALHYAHTQNIVHRDIKPANILLDKDGKPYLTDFGVAKKLSGFDKTLTVTGATVGTPNYMAPEQAQGKKDEIDHQSDVFSLGSTLYHGLTGQMPFQGKEMFEVFSNVIHKDPIAPSTLVKSIPKNIETICLKCMEKEKERRYQTALELAMDLQSYLEGKAIMAERASTMTRMWLKAKRNKAASFGLVSAMLVLFIGFLVVRMVISAGSARQVEENRKKAFAFFDEKKYTESKSLCEKILKSTPSDSVVEALLKRCDEAIEDMDVGKKKAKELARKKAEEERLAQEEAKRKEEAAKRRAEAKALLDRITPATATDERLQIAGEAVKIDVSYSDAYQIIGYACRDKQDFDKAVDNFDKAISYTGTLAPSYYGRGWVTAYINNNFDGAVPDFEKTIKYDPDSYWGSFAKGELEFGHKKYDEALASFGKAIKLSPNYDWAYLNRGTVYYAKNELDKALADFNEALRLNSANSRALVNRGLCYYAKDDAVKAVADFSDVIRINPSAAAVYVSRGNAYYESGNYGKAIEDFNEAVKLNPDNGKIYCDRAAVHYDQGDIEKAIVDFSRAIKLNPTDAESYFNRSVLNAKKGDFGAAIADGEVFLKLSPDHPSAETMRQAIEDWKR